MCDKKSAALTIYSQFSAIIGAVLWLLASGQEANAVTADEVLNEMTPDERRGYVVGVIEGLATARWLQDNPDQTGMQCIFDWYLERPRSDVLNEIETWYERHPERQAGLLLSVLIKQECGE